MLKKKRKYPYRNNGWTAERRRRQAKAIRCWKPWLKSTGPKTAQGKARAKQNALKHGFRGEKYRELCDLLRVQRDFVRNVIESVKFLKSGRPGMTRLYNG